MTFNPDELALLKQVVDATNSGAVVYALPVQMANLAANLLVEGNPNMIDPATGGMAYRATPNGLTYAQNVAAAASPAPVVASAPVAQPTAASGASSASQGVSKAFETGTGFQIPARGMRRPSNNGRTYNFDGLEINGYIFVPATGKRPDPKKSLASTISSANKRYENFTPRRYFRTFRALAGQVFGNGIVAPSNGAYIVRVEPPVDNGEQ